MERKGSRVMTELSRNHKIRFKCFEGESLNGVVARWAASAYIERMLDVTRVAGAVWGQRPSAVSADEAGLTALAHALEINVDELMGRSIHAMNDKLGHHGQRSFFGINLPATLVETKRRRYSPKAFALSDCPFHRALWDLRLLPVCVETGEILLSCCQNPACKGAQLGWRNTLGIDRCEHCMSDLSRSKTKSIPPELLRQLKEMSDLFVPSRRSAILAQLPTELRLADGQLAVDLIVRLLPVVNPLLKSFHRSSSVEPLLLCETLAECWNITLKWPKSFKEFAAKRIDARARHHQDGNCGQTIRFLKGRGPNISQDLKDLIAFLRNSIDCDGPEGSKIKAKTYAIKQAAEILGIGTAKIARLRRAKGLRSIMVLESGSLQLRYDRDEVAEFRNGIVDRIGFDQLRSRFGISHIGIEQMAALGVIEVQPHVFFERYGILQSTKHSVAQFEKCLKCASLAEPPENALSLPKAMTAIGGRKTWGPAFDQMLRSEIPFYLAANSKPLAERIHIDSSDLPTLLALKFTPPQDLKFAFSTKASKLDAMEILNLSASQVTNLFADVPTNKGSRVPVLDIEYVMDIASSCITIREIAARLVISCQAAKALATRSHIPHLGVAGYCRKTAEALLLA